MHWHCFCSPEIRFTLIYLILIYQCYSHPQKVNFNLNLSLRFPTRSRTNPAAQLKGMSKIIKVTTFLSVLWLNIPVNNFSVMPGPVLRVLMCLDQENLLSVQFKPALPFNSKSDTLLLSHHAHERSSVLTVLWQDFSTLTCCCKS